MCFMVLYELLTGETGGKMMKKRECPEPHGRASGRSLFLRKENFYKKHLTTI